MKLYFSILLTISIIFGLCPVFLSEALRYDFENRFEDWTVDIQLKDWTVVNGTWIVKEGAYVQEDIGENPEGLGARSFFGKPEWSDYTIRVRAKVIRYGQNGWFGITFRGQEHERNHYLYQFGVHGGNMPTIVAKVEGGIYNPLANFRPTEKHKLGEWYTFTVEAIGSSIKCYIDDEMVFDIKDKTFEKGKIGLATGLARVAVDEVEVQGPDIPENKAVQPNGKIAMTWGYIKRE